MIATVLTFFIGFVFIELMLLVAYHKRKNDAIIFQYNTVNRQELQGCITDAKKQDELVMEVFNIKGRFTPSECWQYLMNTGRIDDHVYPLTSIRRSA